MSKQGALGKRVSQRTRTQLAFGTAVVLLVISAIAAYSTAVRLRTAQRWVGHTRDVQAALSDVESLGSRAGRARTRYVDTGDAAFFEEYQAAANDIPAKLKLIEALTEDNPAQHDLRNRLLQVTNRRLELLNASVELKRSASPDLPQQALLRQQIIDVSAESDGLVQKMQDNEQQLLEARRQQSELLFRIAAYILCTAFVIALALFFLHYRMLNAELNAREQAEASLRTLSVRLLELQDQERRKFSRELHDSLGQYLVGAKMNLGMLGRSLPENNQLVAECLKLLDQAMTETRTISHLLHPPLLDETGFASAARWYVEGFAKRSGIQTSLDMPEELGRLAPSLELALFRVLQESLTNVHRHSKSRKADVSVKLSEDEVVLRIRDYGQGIPPDVLDRFRSKRAHGGVGLAGMRERIHELGGRLEMDSDGNGTQVVASMPRSQSKNSSEEFAAD
jgi:signal transduction histidine kinase